MKRFLIAIMLALTSAAFAPGCTTQTQQPGSTTQPAIDPVAVAADQVTVAVTALNIVRSTTDASGKPLISDDDWNNLYLPAMHGVQNFLLAWQSTPPNTPEYAKAETAFLASIPDFLRLAQNAQHKSKPAVPTTRPVN